MSDPDDALQSRSRGEPTATAEITRPARVTGQHGGSLETSKLNSYKFDVIAVTTVNVRAETEDQARAMIGGLNSISTRTTGDDIEAAYGLDVSTNDYDVVNVSPRGRGYLVSADLRGDFPYRVSGLEAIPEPILDHDLAGLREALAESDRAMEGDSHDAEHAAHFGLAEAARGLLDGSGRPRTGQPGRYIVTSQLGSRNWHADDAEHAAEQHRDAFPDEPVISVRPVGEEPQARSTATQPRDSATPGPSLEQEAQARAESPASVPRPTSKARKPASPGPGQQAPPQVRRRG